jgi:hypothetical protein
MEIDNLSEDQRKILKLKQFLKSKALTIDRVNPKDKEYAERYNNQWANESFNDWRTHYELSKPAHVVYLIAEEFIKTEFPEIKDVGDFDDYLSTIDISLKHGDIIDRSKRFRMVKKPTAEILNTALVLDISKDKIFDDAIQGDTGVIRYEDGCIVVCIGHDSALSTRQFSAFKKRLWFMKTVEVSEIDGTFTLDRKPTVNEAESIRKVVGIRKSRKQTTQKDVNSEIKEKG